MDHEKLLVVSKERGCYNIWLFWLVPVTCKEAIVRIFVLIPPSSQPSVPGNVYTSTFLVSKYGPVWPAPNNLTRGTIMPGWSVGGSKDDLNISPLPSVIRWGKVLTTVGLSTHPFFSVYDVPKSEGPVINNVAWFLPDWCVSFIPLSLPCSPFQAEQKALNSMSF